jgi:hypothetical protein
MPPHELARRLPERELIRLWTDRNRRQLPHRRIELLLANIARLIDARLGGAENTRVADYLFDPVDNDNEADDDAPPGATPTDAQADQVAAFFGFNPANKRET